MLQHSFHLTAISYAHAVTQLPLILPILLRRHREVALSSAYLFLSILLLLKCSKIVPCYKMYQKGFLQVRERYCNVKYFTVSNKRTA